MCIYLLYIRIAIYIGSFCSIYIYIYTTLCTRGMRCEREYDWILAPAGNVSRFDGDNGNQKTDRCFLSNLVLVCPSDAVRLLDTCLKLSPRFVWLRSSSVRSILAVKPANFNLFSKQFMYQTAKHTYMKIDSQQSYFFLCSWYKQWSSVSEYHIYIYLCRYYTFYIFGIIHIYMCIYIICVSVSTTIA